MIVNETGKYKLTEDFRTRNTCATGTIPKDTIIEITQISEEYHKVIGTDFMDWVYWDLPVVKV
jgi:hypothetical protein